MATYNSDLATDYLASPPDRLDPSGSKGRVRFAHAKFTLSAELAVGDTIEFMRLPKGARVVEMYAIADADAASGRLDVGWDGGVNSLETADDDGFYLETQFDPGAGALAKLAIDSARPGLYDKKFADEVRVLGTCTEVTTDSDTNVWEIAVLFVEGGS